MIRINRREVSALAAVLLSFTSLPAQTNEQWRDSLKVLKQQIETSAYSSDLHLRKAAVNIQLKQWNYAIEEYNTVLSHEPGNISALFYRAYVNMQLRHYELSYNDYTDIIRLHPNHLEARLCLSETCRRMSKKTEAIDHLNYLAEKYTDSVEVFVARAGLEREYGQLDAALFDWDHVLELSPTTPDYHLSRIEILILLNRKAEARKALRALEALGVSRNVLRDWYRQAR